MHLYVCCYVIHYKIHYYWLYDLTLSLSDIWVDIRPSQLEPMFTDRGYLSPEPVYFCVLLSILFINEMQQNVCCSAKTYTIVR